MLANEQYANVAISREMYEEQGPYRLLSFAFQREMLLCV